MASTIKTGPTIFLASAIIALLAGCQHRTAQPPASSPPPPLSKLAQLGKSLFFDPSLSASGQQSCASCHSPASHFGPPNTLAMQLGGPQGDIAGTRTAPSLTYLSETPGFSIGPDADGDADADRVNTGRRSGPVATVKPTVAKTAATAAKALVPRGGFFWDGRADNLAAQALGPLMNPVEMANTNPEELAEKIRRLPYAEHFKAVVDPHILEDSRRLPSYAVFAISRYEMEDPAFHPYNSKYDLYLRGQVNLSRTERRGLKLFEDPEKGNCAACHPSGKTPGGLPPLFTDFQYEALGVPRNPAIRGNEDPQSYDLGICGPTRRDRYSQQPQNCGMFKTPSLRNVATRQAFFHNGRYSTLDEVMHFYVQRDTSPEKFYPRRPDGSVAKYDDLPAQYQGNIDTLDAPFNRKPGDKPALNEAEIKDVIAFLGTLSDGYESP